jgi:hypothetical protein
MRSAEVTSETSHKCKAAFVHHVACQQEFSSFKDLLRKFFLGRGGCVTVERLCLTLKPPVPRGLIINCQDRMPKKGGARGPKAVASSSPGAQQQQRCGMGADAEPALVDDKGKHLASRGFEDRIEAWLTEVAGVPRAAFLTERDQTSRVCSAAHGPAAPLYK